MLEAFLADAGLSDAQRSPLAGDASGRRYERVCTGESSAVLMIAPANSAAEIERFAMLSRHLRGLGLSAPAVLSADPKAGLMLLEDLGNSLYPAAIAADPSLEPELYRAALDCLCVLQTATSPTGVTEFTSSEMADQASLAFTSYALQPQDLPCPYEAPLRDALGASSTAPVLMLRDFHAENLFWLPRRTGVARVGLIDFQDARLASPLYDVVSLLWDARRDLAPDLRRELFTYAADSLGLSLDAARAEAATLTLQRNLRILGVFARLAALGGKPRYLEHIPRVWKYIEESLAAPHLVTVAGIVRNALPAPTDKHLADLHARCNLTPTL